MPDAVSHDDWILVSAVAHYGYCPRRCALIHIEQVFEENLFTMKGRAIHERADDPHSALESGGVRVERALPIWSERLGIHGKADVIEFHPDGRIVPVEYKPSAEPAKRAGKHFRVRPDDLQLCAQAICLEEMFEHPVEIGAIYHHGSRHRREVHFDEGLRAATLEAIEAAREMKRANGLPPPVDDSRCPNCSLIDACGPSVITAAAGRDARRLYRPTDSEGLA